MGKIKVAKLNT